MPWFANELPPYEPIYISRRDLPTRLAAGEILQEVEAPQWVPRASALGGYAACLYRAVSDRMWQEHEGEGWEPEEQGDTSHADHGSVCHFHTQDGVRADFPGPAADHAPDAAMLASAAKLFGGSLERQADCARRAATIAASLLPKLPTGTTWKAEESWNLGYLTGHTDLRYSTGEILVDLKFTSKPPTHNKVKLAHLPQMAGYTRMCKPRRICVIYVDKTNAAWGLPVWIDCMTDQWQWYTEQMMAFAQFLMTDGLLAAATPNVGDHCHQGWCKYTAQCAKRITPPAGLFFNALKARKPTGPMKIEVPTWLKK